ncbi:beta-Ig-H3/fasciclin [Thalassoporum mexicanum PCC 7367]|uniref:fasciclin domain-containing protein n=1 Tax=Thalassoporum mexicanum TaxID=3457544 RepID=UPI00029FAF9E|nr:fasciclin domain-containing protein [Pseudanabaena sp. PCC 7367]AFY69302.1 beta-Ig-H3/fasciclin [Pseudanabaena sp. PCC 7367]
MFLRTFTNLRPTGRFSVSIRIVSIALVVSALGLQACSTNGSTATTEAAPDTATTTVVETATTTNDQNNNEPAAPIAAEPEPPSLTIAAIAKNEPTFSIFSDALATTDLMAKLDQDGSYTVFAPADEAFADLPAGTLEQLLKPENKAQLEKVLSYHIVPEQLLAEEMEPGELNTLAGTALTIEIDAQRDRVLVNQASVIIPDVKASNGNIQIIDRVILPPS